MLFGVKVRYVHPIYPTLSKQSRLQSTGHWSVGEGLPGERGDDEDHWGDGRMKEEIYPKQAIHPFPREIALRAQRLLQGSLFYDIIVDTATGQYFKIVPDGEKKIKELHMSYGRSEENYELSWSCFKDYLIESTSPTHQNAVYSMISHWDWYISNLGKFIHFAESHISHNKGQDNYLLHINRMPFIKQIELLEKTTGLIFAIDNNV
jgi:hypothetical protein